MKLPYIFLVVIAYFFVHTQFNRAAQITGNSFYGIQDTRIYDVLHETLPDLHKMEWATDLMIALSVTPFLLKPNMSFLVEFIGLMLTINIIRDVTINMTILPKHEKCETSTDLRSHIVGSCYDKIFSGHFAFVFVLSLLYYSRGYITNVPALIALNVANAAIIILTRSHYTNDIIISFFVCALVVEKRLNFFRIFK